MSEHLFLVNPNEGRSNVRWSSDDIRVLFYFLPKTETFTNAVKDLIMRAISQLASGGYIIKWWVRLKPDTLLGNSFLSMKGRWPEWKRKMLCRRSRAEAADDHHRSNRRPDNAKDIIGSDGVPPIIWVGELRLAVQGRRPFLCLFSRAYKRAPFSRCPAEISSATML